MTFLKEMTFAEGGAANGPWRWTKGWLQNPSDKVQGRYWIRKVNGKTYLFMEWISGDVTIRGKQPWFYVLKKDTGSDFWKMKNRPFVSDPDLVGEWRTVDFVRSPEHFRPGKKQWTGDLNLKGISFYGDGKTSGPWVWTKGYIQHPGDETEARYSIRDMNGAKYLFMEWISGDVTLRGQKPWFYVLEKTGSDTPAAR